MNRKNFIKSVLLISSGVSLGVSLTLFIHSYDNNLPNKLIIKNLVSVNGKVWTTADLPDDLLVEYYNIENSIYNSQKYFAEQLGLRIELASEKGKIANKENIPKLSDLFVNSKVNDSEIRKYYDDMIHKMGANVFAGQSFEKLKPQIAYQLTHEKINEMSKNKIGELTNSGKFKVLLSAPLGAPISLDTSIFPKRGNENNNITFVSVVDYMDPKSREIEPKIEELYKKFSSKINFINIPYSQFQNSINGFFAKGAYCAKEQGQEQFWNFNNLSFKKSLPSADEQRILNDSAKMNAEVIQVAKSAHLDIDKFSSCLNSNNIRIELQNVQNKLYASGEFKGAPSFYINKRSVRVSLQELENTLKDEVK
ncbi:DsbA family protein [Silvanigrella aquatica]|uniref:Thioredoxin-like fold domain-containing protein n=1 Tax=Silvanigrella aquatica TaxID=1915309 RepID=A0A1L4D0Q5_9BACT|nr:thioredoxin domain-containing protein [Silvanigrella aquatica]APJ03781.1 hypothetical protein AXG55_07625 [Silvanigrella aquatica]